MYTFDINWIKIDSLNQIYRMLSVRDRGEQSLDLPNTDDVYLDVYKYPSRPESREHWRYFWRATTTQWRRHIGGNGSVWLIIKGAHNGKLMIMHYSIISTLCMYQCGCLYRCVTRPPWPSTYRWALETGHGYRTSGSADSTVPGEYSSRPATSQSDAWARAALPSSGNNRRATRKSPVTRGETWEEIGKCND